MSGIFISYSHRDSEYAHKLAKALEQKGFSVWIDDRIDYGDQWPRVIQESIDSCIAFIVIMTSSAYQSRWVQNELTYAYDENKPIFPLLLEGKRWVSVAATQTVDVRTGELPQESFYSRLAEESLRQNHTAFVLPLLEWCNIPSGSVKVLGKTISVDSFSLAKRMPNFRLLSVLWMGIITKSGGSTQAKHLPGTMKISLPFHLLSRMMIIREKWSTGTKLWRFVNG